jgi:hypothetical protein
MTNAYLDLNRASGKSRDIKQAVHDQFQYHPWDEKQKAAGDKVRNALEKASLTIINEVPPCADRSTALRKLREACMDANSAIAHKGKY